MRLVLLGPPGAGKGTQAELLSKKYNIPHISTGDILREAVREKSRTGMEAKSYMDKGELVPDNIVVKIVVEGLSRPDTSGGFILDGFPRNRTQAESLSEALADKKISIDRVLYFETSPDTIISRLTGRRVCPKCNAIYHIINNVPIKNGVCDKCGSKLYQREDDKEETIRKRMEVYRNTESGLMSYYRKTGLLTEASGDLRSDELFRSLIKTFGKDSLK